MNFYEHLYKHQKEAIESQKDKKCLINMWCGTGKTRTFTIDLFINNENFNVIVFPSLGLINQYGNDYILNRNEPFISQFEKFNCLAFCSDDVKKLNFPSKKIKYTTNKDTLCKFIRKSNLIVLVTYQSFEKFINVCINENMLINNLIFDEAHHIVGDKIQNIVFNNKELDYIVDKTRFYTATPVNKNCITMYDRDDPENSDCGTLAYEYLYYQAVEDRICKPFETQISLYRQKPEYTNKYQPVFESIIRACLSGKYNYWNILTYHSFVNENEDMNINISFVNDFASTKNQNLIKKLFTRIQNEEYPHTKELYSVENVILKGVHSETKTRKQIIKNFDKKVQGRIYILASCGILNEGIDTKWANMGVPINPTKSIVKESQRIGRLVRIPEDNMSPAIILIPCEVDITKYSSMDTAEKRDQMIREELSECGNFNTVLNVISAFKYQYDPELFEMCLKYPNMYAPKEVKDNLAKQGLIVEDSQGDLLDNLKYVCGKEGIYFETNGDNFKKDILNNISKQIDKTIEIHTQNYDEPIKYINKNAINEEPLQLFYCDDDNTYSPIVKKNKKQKIKKKSTTPQKKRPKLFDVHQHPDLEVLWKIKESCIDLNKIFSQGILDVDINWNEKKWEQKLIQLKEFIDTHKRTPGTLSKNPVEKQLGYWLSVQKTNYKKKINIMKKIKFYNEWTQFITNYSKYVISWTELWNHKFNQLKGFININKRTPIEGSKNSEEKQLCSWLSNQKYSYKNKNSPFKTIEIYDKWTQFITDYSKYFISNDELWNQKLIQLKEFIDTHKRTPNLSSENPDEKQISTWLSHQKRNYSKKNHIMKKIEIYDKWNQFSTEYSKYVISNDELWNHKLIQLKEFIDTHKRTPRKESKNGEEKQLGTWLSDQKYNYTKKKNIMKKGEIYDKWTQLITDYSKYFISYDDLWKQNLTQLKEFIDINKRIPNLSSENPDEKQISTWLSHQKRNYSKKNHIMKKIEIYDKWNQFSTEYSKYVISNDELWNHKLIQLKEFIDTHKRTPIEGSKNLDEKQLGIWLSNQKQTYKNKTRIMLKLKFYKIWTKFITDYSKYFVSYDDLWNQKLIQLKEFIDTHKRTPKQSIKNTCSKNSEEKQLGKWLSHQVSNYKYKTRTMKKSKIYDKWTHLINESTYSKHFDT